MSPPASTFKPTEERTTFFHNHIIVNKETACWTWISIIKPRPIIVLTSTRITNHPDTGKSRYRRVVTSACRYAWVLQYGEDSLADRAILKKTCEGRNCVSPFHHKKETQRTINEESRRAARLHQGESAGTAKLTEEQVINIRELYDLLDPNYKPKKAFPNRVKRIYRQRDLAEMYGVNTSLIGPIVKGRIWTHVGGPIQKKHHSKRYRKDGKGAKLSSSQVYDIRSRVDQGQTCASVARLYDIASETVVKIARRITWSHLTEQNEDYKQCQI